MAQQSIHRGRPANAPEDANFDAAWRKLRDQLEARIEARFGVASDPQGSGEPDPDVLADLALERALMS